MLSPEQHKLREDKVTASFLPALMGGNDEAILREWRRLVGDPAYVREDLSDKWAVEFGSYIEPFALNWHAKKTGVALIRRAEHVVCPSRSYFSCTLDAYRASDDTVIDCKAPGQWRRLDEVISYYTPQMIGQRACVGAKRASLLIVHGGSEPQEYPVEWSAEYEAEVWKRVEHFYDCVENLIPPVALPGLSAPVKAEVAYDYTKNNHWCSEAVTYLTTKTAASNHEAAKKQLKKLMPADAARVFGGGIEAARNKAGSISFKELA